MALVFKCPDSNLEVISHWRTDEVAFAFAGSETQITLRCPCGTLHLLPLKSGRRFGAALTTMPYRPPSTSKGPSSGAS